MEEALFHSLYNRFAEKVIQEGRDKYLLDCLEHLYIIMRSAGLVLHPLSDTQLMGLRLFQTVQFRKELCVLIRVLMNEDPREFSQRLLDDFNEAHFEIYERLREGGSLYGMLPEKMDKKSLVCHGVESQSWSEELRVFLRERTT